MSNINFFRVLQSGGVGGEPPTGTPLIFEVTVTNVNTNVKLPYDSNGTYTGTIDWGDGNTTTNTFANKTHTYTSTGTYQIEILGRSSFIRFYNSVNDNTNNEQFTKLVQFGDPMQFERLSFGSPGNLTAKGAVNMDFSQVTDTPNFDAGASLEYFLSGMDVNNFINIGNWDVSSVTIMESAFEANTTFNQNLNSWNVSSVTTMEGMFYGAETYNQPLNNWDVSSVTNMSRMFSEAYIFNQDIGDWDVSSVTRMNSMFMGDLYNGGTLPPSTTFNQDIGGWDVSNVTQMGFMFGNNSAFNKYIGNWNTSNVTYMVSMFQASPFNQPLTTQQVTVGGVTYTAWDTSNVTTMAGMFDNATSFNQTISNWDVSNVINMSVMFRDSIFDLPLTTQSVTVGGVTYTAWDVSSVTSMFYMFRTSIFNQNISSWDVSSVTNMGAMFENNQQINQNLSGWNVTNVVLCGDFSNGATSWTLAKPSFTNCTP